jgi:hypothetical protein
VEASLETSASYRSSLVDLESYGVGIFMLLVWYGTDNTGRLLKVESCEHFGVRDVSLSNINAGMSSQCALLLSLPRRHLTGHGVCSAFFKTSFFVETQQAS